MTRLFITFEGIEGCGKTTQARRLAKHLKRYGISVVFTVEPGGTRIGKGIRRILLNSRNKDLAPLAELMMYVADRAQHVEEVIKPALDEGKWVICDRLSDSTVVYQGWARGQDMWLVKTLNKRSAQGIEPDLTFVLDCPVEVGLGRALKRDVESTIKGQSRFENEKIAFHRQVRKGYLKLARENPGRFIVINASGGRDSIQHEILEHVIRVSKLGIPG